MNSLSAAIRILQEERRDAQAGQLGNRRGARDPPMSDFRTTFAIGRAISLLTEQVRSAIQAIYDHPLTTEAVDKLNRQLRTHISDDDLAQLVTTLHRDERLVVSGVHDTELKQPRILCSMGLVAQSTQP